MSNKLYVKSGYVLTLIAQSVSLAISMLLSQPLKSEAQSVIPAPDGTGTQVRIHENQIQIYGGSLSSDEANLFHSLQQFGLTEGQIANFIANPNLNNIVTRITGGAPSVINGVLQVTGGDPNLFLMNPSGIIFGATAQLNLPASFAATTANGIQFGNQWFSATGANNYGNLVGNPTAFYFDSNAGTIINAGNLAINPQHSLLFLGGSVINTGQLSVPEGQVLVTAVPDRNVLHLQVPGNILTLEVKLPDELASQPHVWTLPIAALPELLTSEAVTPELLGLAITDAGDVQLADSNMRVPNQAGTAIVSGVVDVSGDRGGSVGIFGNLVGVADAQINASGTFGGGTVLVGGEYRGQGTVPTAERTYVSRNSTIAADALTSGDGGRVIVWADGATAFYGGIAARGGANSGNGGFAEVSGREYLVFDGNANLSALSGEAGTLLLDPDNINIVDGANAPNDPELDDGRILQTDAPGTDFTISEDALRTAAESNNIELSATNNITVIDANPGVVNALDFGDRGTSSITFTAQNGAFTMAREDFILTRGRTIQINAATIDIGTIGSNDGPGLGPADGGAGDIILNSTGNITVQGLFARSQSDPDDINPTTGEPRGVGPGRGGLIRADAGGDFTALGNVSDGLNNSNPVAIRTSGLSGTGGVEIIANSINIPNGQVSSFVNTNPAQEESSAVGGSVSLEARTGTINVRGINSDSLSLTSPIEVIVGGTFTISDSDVASYSINTRNQELLINTPRLAVPSSSVIRAPITLDSDVSEIVIDTISGTGQLTIDGSINSSDTSTSLFRTSVDIFLNGDIGNNNPLGSIEINGNLVFGGTTISTFNEQTYNNLIILEQPNSVIRSNSGNIIFNGVINSAINEFNNISLISDDGNIAINNTIGQTSEQRLGNITLGNFSDFTISSAIRASGIQQASGTVGQTATLAGDITTTNTGVNLTTIGDITANNLLRTGGSTTLVSRNGSINVTDVTVTDGDLSATANTGVTAAALNSENGNIALRSNAGNLQATDISAIGNISAIANTGVVAERLNSTGGDVTLRSGTANVQATDISAAGDVTAIANTRVVASNIDSTGGAVTLRSGTGNVQATDVSAAGDVAAIANTGVTANNIDSTGGDVTLRSGTANVQATDVSAAGDVTAIAERNVTATDINSTGGSITATANNGAVQVSNLTSSGDVSVTALGTIRSTSGITSNGGDISLSSPQSITTETLTSNGGDISLGNNGGATGSVQVTGDINALGAVDGGDVEVISEAALDLSDTNINTSGRTGSGGDITLRSVDGRIAVNNLTAIGRTGGGNVSVVASELEDLAITLSIGEINTSASIGDGGNVLLDPFGNIQVSFINAQGGINGIGGDVTAITTGGLFRAIDSFIDQNGIDASISAAGGAGEGSISIFHNGGDLFIPFFVAVDGVDISAANASGTVGALTTGNPAVNEDNIIENRVFPGTFVQDRIGIFTSDRFTLAADDAVPDAEPNNLQLEDTDQQPFWLDEYFTRTMEEYLSRSPETAVEPTRVKSLEEIRDDLSEIERITGARPALIYVVFEPEQIREALSRNRSQMEPTQDRLTNQGLLLRMEEANTDQLQLVLVTANKDQPPILRRVDNDNATRTNATATALNLARNIFDDYDEYQSGFDNELYLQDAQQIYDWLVRPLRKELKRQKINNLIFIMDSGLRSIPLATLSVMHSKERNQFIIEEGFSVGLMPSFSLTDATYRNIRELNLISFGISSFSTLSSLPGAVLEANYVQSLWDGNSLLNTSIQTTTENPRVRTNAQATTENLKKTRLNSNAGIIHLATHASVQSKKPRKSYIQFFDRQLSLNEFKNLNFNDPVVELLVLSACQTAGDNEGAELGFAGLAVQLGVRSSIASLWDIEDIGSVAIMGEFYRALHQNPIIKAEALRRAQLGMIRGQVRADLEENTLSMSDGSVVTMVEDIEILVEDFSHPYYWAGFTLVGNPW